MVPLYMAIFTCCFINWAGSHVFPITTVKCLQLGIALWFFGNTPPKSKIIHDSHFAERRTIWFCKAQFKNNLTSSYPGSALPSAGNGGNELDVKVC